MEIRSDSIQFHCRTCLSFVDALGGYSISNSKREIIDDLRTWLNQEGPESGTDNAHLPQQLCQNCYEMVQAAKEFQTKVQQSEHLLMTQMDVKMEHEAEAEAERQSTHRLITCRICLRQHPQAVKSLICRVRDAPNLKEWLDWSNLQTVSDAWYSQMICRFCYSRLRDCYEWCLAAEESAAYLRMLAPKSWAWDEFSAAAADAQTKQNTLNDVDQCKERASEFGVYTDYSSYGTLNAISYEQDYLNLYEQSFMCLGAESSDVKHNTNPYAYDHDRFVAASGDLAPMTALAQDTQENKTQQDPDLEIAQPLIKECQHCKKRFKKIVLLEAHILQVHEGRKRPFLCKFCSAAYLTHTHLKRHMKNSHKN